MGIEEKLALAKETISHTKIVVEDMQKNRSEYSSKDLSWRNVDLMYSLIKAFESLTEMVEESLIVTFEKEQDQEEPPLSRFLEPDMPDGREEKKEQPLHATASDEERSLIAEEERIKALRSRKVDKGDDTEGEILRE